MVGGRMKLSKAGVYPEPLTWAMRSHVKAGAGATGLHNSCVSRRANRSRLAGQSIMVTVRSRSGTWEDSDPAGVLVSTGRSNYLPRENCPFHQVIKRYIVTHGL